LDYDITVTCSYPFTNWVLRRPVINGLCPPHVFVTENGDWPASINKSEARLFGCEGLICTNPEYYERNKNKWRSRLIPNGIDCNQFRLGMPRRSKFGLPETKLVILMVSALAPNKRVDLGIAAASRIPDAHLVVAGDGPLRHVLDSIAAEMMPGRFTRLLIPPDEMPSLYQSANVFLHLAADESFGNVFLESMACGLPVVAPDNSRIRWIVGNDEFLLNSDDPAAVARQIDIALRAPSTWRQVRFGKAQAFTQAKIAKMYRQFLEEIVDSHR
jgi:glycosyltransferase involved in cell wall biosynthesis